MSVTRPTTESSKIIPLNQPADGVNVFESLADLPYPFMLNGHWSFEADFPQGNCSIVGAEPIGAFESRGEVVTFRRGETVETKKCDPLDALRAFLPRITDSFSDRLPFCGGAVGFFSYELGRVIEPAAATGINRSPFPDIRLFLYDTAIVVDEDDRACIIQTDLTGDEREMTRKANDWMSRLSGKPKIEADARPTRISGDYAHRLPWNQIKSNLSFDEYRQRIEAIQEYIRAGDVYQVNVARRLEAETNIPAWKVFRHLLSVNPAPYACYLPYPDFSIASASPEMFLTYSADTRVVETRPIKGTRPRGATPEEDTALEQELLLSPKDRAENVMIVDMLRNDLGRVAEYGSVHVTKLFDIERHPSVFQMVSTVKARMANGFGPTDLLHACLPGGSITGAPKVRAMQIIEELEPHPRGPYTGCAGFIDLRGNMLLNILIRTIIMRDGIAHFHSGGGILIDSDVKAEYRETQYKAAGMLKALILDGS